MIYNITILLALWPGLIRFLFTTLNVINRITLNFKVICTKLSTSIFVIFMMSRAKDAPRAMGFKALICTSHTRLTPATSTRRNRVCSMLRAPQKLHAARRVGEEGESERCACSPVSCSRNCISSIHSMAILYCLFQYQGPGVHLEVCQ